MTEKKYPVWLTAREADALMHAAGNIIDAEDTETQLQFFGSRRTMNAAWRAAEALRPLVHIHCVKERDR